MILLQNKISSNIELRYNGLADIGSLDGFQTAKETSVRGVHAVTQNVGILSSHLILVTGTSMTDDDA